jgi:hypothetical protein
LTVLPHSSQAPPLGVAIVSGTWGQSMHGEPSPV